MTSFCLDARVGGDYPVEAQPAVDELNAMLDEREHRVARAMAKAGDLAHGLKTPLAVLAHEAQQVRAAGHEQLAAEIDRMRRQIDYHLARAGSVASSASPGARASIAASAEGIARVLQRLHSERGVRVAQGSGLRVQVSQGSGLRVRVAQGPGGAAVTPSAAPRPDLR